jgi:hypothetical protein
MPDNTNVNNNAAVVVVGRTAPVPPGQQNAANSVPVVVASDQSPIPVEEQNKQQSEVALSLLGIPRSEVALGIFADVNTYDVNPTEWTAFPEQFTSIPNEDYYTNIGGPQDWGLTHIPEEAGALIEAPADNYSILTSKRFFRYQPGRVSAATFGVKNSILPYTIKDGAGSGDQIRNPSNKKFGIFDKYDGYYFEVRNDGKGDNFICTRRTQSIIRENPLAFGTAGNNQIEDYAESGIGLTTTNAENFINAFEIIKANKNFLMDQAAHQTSSEDVEKCKRDVGLVIEGYLHDLKYGGNASTVYNAKRYFNKATGNYFVDAGVEIDRHTKVRANILALLGGNNPPHNNVSTPFYKAGDLGLPSAESGAVGAVTTLSNIILNGLADISTIPEPNGSAYGELILLRDGLIMVHAAANDVSLLKEKVDYLIQGIVDFEGAKWLKVAVPSGKDNIQVGQTVSYNKNGNTKRIVDVSSSPLPDGFIYHAEQVIARRENNNTFNLIKLCLNPSNEESYTGVGGANPTNPWGGGDSSLAYPSLDSIEIIEAQLQDGTPSTIGINDGHSLQTPTAFIMPSDQRKYTGNNYTDRSLNDNTSNPYADGCFPYVYPPNAGADGSVGYIDTAADNPLDLKSQINYVNKRLYKNWCYFNVDPKYYKVYEYRVPRSRFSSEKVNGRETDIFYSDNVLDKTAGDVVVDEATGEGLIASSIWNLDFTKVTMFKVEFSWYGAVGATFLAYVPVGNNEARWLRIHHLRASNQLKVASLGNATLPITYFVYGGGSENKYGYKDTDRLQTYISTSGSFSEFLTKYGASYYIDGGDRGTVRLFSYASDMTKEVYGSRYRLGVSSWSNAASNQDTTIGTSFVNAPYITIGSTNDAPAISDYYIGAKVFTRDSRDQNIRVIWTSGSRLYLSKPVNQTSGAVDIIVDRPVPLIGLKCREEINEVRNRVQIYPTRLATGVTSTSESLVIQLIKSPLYQTFDTVGAGLLSINGTNKFVNIGKRGKTIFLGSEAVESGGTFLTAGKSTYGYFRYTILGDTSGNAYTILGLLEKDDSGYYFTASEKTPDEILIKGAFLKVGNYGGPSPEAFTPLTETYPTSTLNALSAVLTDTEERSPIPGTGVVITTIFSPNSGAEFDLSPYFDYNKDYLSFPLTDLVESLYICASSKSFFRANDGSGNPTGAPVRRGEILASITWEEQ